MTMSCSETVSSANRNKRHFTVYIESEHILRMCAKKIKNIHTSVTFADISFYVSNINVHNTITEYN